MNQDDLPRSDWYSAAPNSVVPYTPAPDTGAQPSPSKKHSHTGAKIVGIVACVLLVLVGSVYVFSDRFGQPWIARSDEGDGWRSFTIRLPGGTTYIDIGGDGFVIGEGGGNGERSDGGDIGGDGSEDILPDGFGTDYRDYYYRYYNTKGKTNEHAPSEMERVSGSTDFRLTLQSAEGQTERSLQELYPECQESVVGIASTAKRLNGYYWGTGVILSEDGYILTNQHLVAGCDAAWVTLPDGTVLEALLVGENADTDLAVLKVEATGLHPAEFGDSGELTVGDSVFAIGNPVLPTLPGTLTSGIVSGLARNISGSTNAYPLIQHTASINEGSSGGALFNMYGQVVGITNMKLTNRTSDVIVEDMCFAIPSTTARSVANRLLSGKTYVRPGIGITVRPVDGELAARYGLDHGLYIDAVSPGSDAEAKGLREGDIVLKANGQELHDNQDLLTLKDSLQEGDSLTLTVLRDGETFDVEITLVDFDQLY